MKGLINILCCAAAWSPQCGTGWRYNPLDAACYSLNSDVATFATAEARCINAGGQLASIHSDREQSFIAGLNAALVWYFYKLFNGPTVSYNSRPFHSGELSSSIESFALLLRRKVERF